MLGEDRPGLVESLASIIAAHEGNWSESRMAQLAGQFAGILRASVPDANAAALINALQGLAGRGLKPQPEADRNTLIRRVSFDITGLPPTPAEIETFVKDAAPDAYERLVSAAPSAAADARLE